MVPVPVPVPAGSGTLASIELMRGYTARFALHVSDVA